MPNMVCEELAKKGYRCRLVSGGRVEELRQHIENMHTRHRLSGSFYAYLKERFDFAIPEGFNSGASILITAAESPRLRVFFNYRGQRTPLFIPPTYAEIANSPERIINLVREIPKMRDCRMETARLPEKLLAVKCGLGVYGRNNICYVPGLGSFAGLDAFYIDVPCQEEQWQEIKIMDACQNCAVCAYSCPTGAIDQERLLIDAERCLTYYNEDAAVFPDWLDPAWHNSIIGCRICQEACPENKKYLERIIDMAEFSEQETQLLLDNPPLERIPDATKEKMQRLNMLIYYDCLARNLQVLLEKQTG